MEHLPEFIANHTFLVLSFLAVAGFLAWNIFGGAAGLEQVDPMQAVQLINHEDAVIVDVRESSEFIKGHVLDAMHVPLGSLSNQLGKLQKYKNSPVILSCQSGHRSAQACKTLKQNGFEKIYNMRGGIMAWQNAGLPVQKGNKKTKA
jgi:rhodanese-related sulfurtransferase